MEISVIGCGRWGSFIAWYLDHIGHDVLLYGRESSHSMQGWMQTRSNGLLELPANVALSTSLHEAAKRDTIVISIASQSLHTLMQALSPLCLREKTLVLCMKGLQVESCARLSEVAAQYMPAAKVAVWLGPGHVQEFTRGIPNCMVIDSEHTDTRDMLVQAFGSELIRFYYGQDLLGNEIGAAAKNVIGIAAGILDGLSMSTLKGALTSRGAREISRLIAAMGGHEMSAYGLCHLGDYGATVFSEFSHNRMFGEAFARGESYDKLAEGVHAVHALVLLGERYGVDLPISRAVYDALYGGVPVGEAIGSLFMRSIKSEF